MVFYNIYFLIIDFCVIEFYLICIVEIVILIFKVLYFWKIKFLCGYDVFWIKCVCKYLEIRNEVFKLLVIFGVRWVSVF